MSSDIKIELQSARVIADGKEFGDVGCYEYLTGWIHFEIEPNSPLPTKIVDLENASKMNTAMSSILLKFTFCVP